jgi:nucleoside diphosphate kinase
MTTHWLRRPGPGTWAMLVLTGALAAVAVVLHLVGLDDPEASAPGSLRNVFVFATFVSGFVTYFTARGRR